MNPINKYTDLFARVLLVGLFAIAGLGKLGAYAGTQAYMAQAGVPGFLLPLVLLTEIGGSLAIVLGYHTRLVAVLLAGFSVVAALVFHSHFADQIQQIMFLKNLSIAGGFLLLALHGAGELSLDARRSATAPALQRSAA